MKISNMKLLSRMIICLIALVVANEPARAQDKTTKVRSAKMLEFPTSLQDGRFETPPPRLIPSLPPATSEQPARNLPTSPKTIQYDRSIPSNPFLGRRSADFATIPGPRSLPPTTSALSRTPSFVGHGIELYEKMHMGPRIAQDRHSAIESETQRLPAGQFETRHVWEYDYQSGLPLSGSTVILTNPQYRNLLSASRRRTESVTIGRWPTPSTFIGDAITEAQISRNVIAMRNIAELRNEYDRQKLAYDRVRSLLTPPGQDAATLVRDFVPQAGPTPRRGVQVCSRAIGPMPDPVIPLPPKDWHPPMSLPK